MREVFRMRLLGFLEFVIVFIGVAGMAAANTYFLPKGIHLGLFLVGAGIALGGLESIFTRQMSFRFTSLGSRPLRRCARADLGLDAADRRRDARSAAPTSSNRACGARRSAT